MFCPNCAVEDRNNSQYCRACGTELLIVRAALQRPDEITSSAIAARDQIGRAIASKIKELRSGHDLVKVAEDVLPQVEKFLESSEERRLRHFRQGVVTASVGLGVLLFLSLVGFITPVVGEAMVPYFVGIGGGIITLLIGLGIIVNARWFTVLPKALGHAPRTFAPLVADELSTSSLAHQPPAAPTANIPSVTEGTTRQLRQ